ncbi:MAG: hypothetical protein ACMXX9_04460 [Candidatus Woesearchaeota archaeon]
MGFLDLFKKQNAETKTEEDIKPPAQGELEPLDNTTKSVDENASFEIPDFSEEDLDFDLGIEDFMPEDKPMMEDQKESELDKPLQDHNQFRDFFQFEGGQELQTDPNSQYSDIALEDTNSEILEENSATEQEVNDFDLPKIEVEQKEELPLFELEQKEEKESNIQSYSDQKIVFLERHKYADIIDLQIDMKLELVDQIGSVLKSQKLPKLELNIYEDIKEQLDSIQHSLLYIDKKLFG